jgi:hypothetical protein
MTAMRRKTRVCEGQRTPCRAGEEVGKQIGDRQRKEQNTEWRSTDDGTSSRQCRQPGSRWVEGLGGSGVDAQPERKVEAGAE